ncbi:hypothetical protein F4V43_02340 [Paenibacillus spiritus]|uniref:Uncharacterized protein n=1 Tax=Paenibacillus spiritus TaxID=2496557 RepID=A0A5J5GGS2_9BACL|nr:hypothetical protein [Paenibacillus spiritus]KAA9007345.1 hypothetical protein F4V43_02340 [Paenibacillus spiritus]
MSIVDIKTVSLTNFSKVYTQLGIDYSNSLQIVDDYGTEDEQSIYVGTLLYNLEADKDFTFTTTTVGENSSLMVMDGVKRINAILRFLDGQITVGGKKVTEFKEEYLNKVTVLFTIIGADERGLNNEKS